MSYTTSCPAPPRLNAPDPVPNELVALKECILEQPPQVRAVLEPLIDEAVEHAMFRSRAMLIAREALQRFRVDLAAMRFDLEATKRECRIYP